MHREQAPAADPGRAAAHAASRARPFRIAVEQAVLDDLERRLARTRWPRHPGEPGWGRGASPVYLRELVDHWRSAYDWRAEEARLNALPQFTAEVGGERLHFVHVRGRSPRATPLVLLHGWPDTFHRFHRAIPQLADPATPGGSFDIIVPSLPGFPLTGALRQRPSAQPVRRIAALIHRLVTDVLGHDRFAVAGGDTGSAVAQRLAIDFPDAVIGIHITDLGWHATMVDPAPLPSAEQKYLAAQQQRFLADGAYAMVQTTRPRSLAVGLTDSPVGLAAWIVDRFHAWSDGDLDARFGKDALLTNIMLYWVTRAIGSSLELYRAEARSPSLTAADRVERPVAVALFPDGAGGTPPRSFAERTLCVQRWTEMPRGGHFAALEEPALYARDVVAFFRSLTGPPGAS